MRQTWLTALMGMMATVTAAASDETGFVSIFNDRDLSGWTGDTNAYYVAEPGVLACGPRANHPALQPDDALMTVKEYADFIIRFECQIEPGADNGLGIRYPGVDDMAYSGVEMQLADTAKVTERKDTWRTMGGFYGVSYALDDRTAGQKVIGGTYVKPCGEWNAVELRAQGSKLTAWLNGVKVNDCDLSALNPRTGFDRHSHSGVRARKGHVVWWVGNPGKTVKWRNLRIRELKSAAEVDADKRRFIYSDFMNRKLVYVDEGNPAAYWEAFMPEVCFDITLAGLHRLYAAQKNGWREYGLSQLRFVREVKDAARMKYVTSACEGPDGHIYALEQQGAVHEFTREGEWLFTYTFPSEVRHGRALRFTRRGTALIGIDDGVAEVKLEREATPAARLVRCLVIPDSRSAYQGELLADGRVLATGGYRPVLATFAPDGSLTGCVTANQPQGLVDFFYGGFTVRPNGNVLLANWTGHNGQDFQCGWKLIEFSPAGEVVWKWNAPWAGTPNAVIAFD